MKKIVLLAFLSLLLSTAVVVKFIRPVIADETIYIMADGSVDPPTAPILGVDNVTYTFTDNINDSIVVQRDNIVVDGRGYTLQGGGTGIDLTGRSNVTIKNIEINKIEYGIYLYRSSNNTIYQNNITNGDCGIWIQESSNNNRILGNDITNNDKNGIVLLYSSNNTVSGNDITTNDHGMYLYDSSNNTISGNNITNNRWDGIHLYSSSFNWVSANILTTNKAGVRLLYFSNNNSISGNNETNNEDGTRLWKSSNNSIYENNITTNNYGIWLLDSSDNFIYHNNFVGNTKQLHSYNSTNVWDDGYPSGGNYWSDYKERYPDAEEIDGSGIWDTPYVIDENNRDNYPLMSPWGKIPEGEAPFWMQWWFWTIVIAGIVVLAGVIYFLKKRKPPTPTALPLPT